MPPSIRTPSDERRFHLALGSLLGAGLLLRIAYVYAQSRTDPWFAFPMADAAAYLEWARARLAGVAAARDAYDQPPLYAWFLTAFLKLFGEKLGLLYYVQHLLLVGAAGLVGLTVRRLVGRLAGLAACALFLLYGPNQFFASRVLGEPIAIALLVASLFVWTASTGRCGAPASGVLAGLASVARPNLGLAAPLWALAASRRSFLRAVLLVVGFGLALIPSTVRNFVVSGHFVPVSSNAGLTLYHGNAAGATGFIHVIPELAQAGKGDQRRVATWLASRRSGRELDPIEADRYWGGQAVRERLADPLGSAGLLLRRAALLVWNAELTLDSGPRQDANPMRWAAPVPFAVLLGLAVAGLALTGWRGTGGWPVWSTVLSCAVAPLVFYVSSRYRLPMAAMLCLPAGAGLAALLRPPEGVSSRRRWVGLALLVAVGTLSLVVPDGGLLAQADAAGLVQRGAAWRRVGDLQRAESDFREAVERNPGWVPAIFKLAEVLDHAGRGAEAEGYFRQALDIQPGYANAACYYGQLLVVNRRPDEALVVLRQGLESHPYHEVCWHYLVGALAMLGRVDEAERGLVEAEGLGVQVSPELARQVHLLSAAAPTNEEERP